MQKKSENLADCAINEPNLVAANQKYHFPNIS
jgi:hypothetical protein